MNITNKSIKYNPHASKAHAFLIEFRIDKIAELPGCKNFFICAYPVIENNEIIDFENRTERGDHPNDTISQSWVTVSYVHPLKGEVETREEFFPFGDNRKIILSIIKSTFTLSEFAQTVHNYYKNLETNVNQEISSLQQDRSKISTEYRDSLNLFGFLDVSADKDEN